MQLSDGFPSGDHVSVKLGVMENRCSVFDK